MNSVHIHEIHITVQNIIQRVGHYFVEVFLVQFDQILLLFNLTVSLISSEVFSFEIHFKDIRWNHFSYFHYFIIKLFHSNDLKEPYKVPFLQIVTFFIFSINYTFRSYWSDQRMLFRFTVFIKNLVVAEISEAETQKSSSSAYY